MRLKPMAKNLALLGMIVGGLACAISFYNTLHAQMELGRSFSGSILYFFSYYTNWTNILLVLIYAAALRGWSKFSSPVIAVTGLSSILLVMIVYHFLLSATHYPEGIDWYTNRTLHYVTPVIFPLFWLVCNQKGGLNWTHLYKTILFPLVYLIFTYVKAAITNEYPYDFLNISLKGIAGVAPIIAAIVVLILVISSLAIIFQNKTVRQQD